MEENVHVRLDRIEQSRKETKEAAEKLRTRIDELEKTRTKNNRKIDALEKEPKINQENQRSTFLALLKHPYFWFVLTVILGGIGMFIHAAALEDIRSMSAAEMVRSTPYAANIMFVLQGVFLLGTSLLLLGVLCYMAYSAVHFATIYKGRSLTNSKGLAPGDGPLSHFEWLASHSGYLIVYAICFGVAITGLVLSIGFFANPTAFSFMGVLFNFMGSGLASGLKFICETCFGISVSEETLSAFLIVGQIYAAVVLTLFSIVVAAILSRGIRILAAPSEPGYPPTDAGDAYNDEPGERPVIVVVPSETNHETLAQGTKSPLQPESPSESSDEAVNIPSDWKVGTRIQANYNLESDVVGEASFRINDIFVIKEMIAGCGWVKGTKENSEPPQEGWVPYNFFSTAPVIVENDKSSFKRIV